MHFLKVGWRQRSSANENENIENTSDRGIFTERPGKRLSSLSTHSVPPIIDKNDRPRSASEVRNPQSLNPANPNDICSTNQDRSRLFGLNLVHDSPTPSGDIILVHGLGGHASRTWCWNRDPNYFWPKWLAEDQDLSSYRVFTFGYNSGLAGSDSNLNIVDFAKDLLFQMLTFSNGIGGNGARIGDRSIIFVCHSLGGIVVKKAYILGKHDPEFAHIISRVYGILFLATPHRGSQYAKTISMILSTIPMVVSGKSYLEDLDAQSTILQDVNEQFKSACENLALVSFFESKKTNFGIAEVYVVPKESAMLGYPGEISIDLKADHHNICKFKDSQDGNYNIVKNTLKLWASRIRSIQQMPHSELANSNRDSIKKLEAILDILEPTEDDLNTTRSRIMKGTCQWILKRPDFIKWFERPPKPENPDTFWLIGLPATGKTALATSVVDHIQSKGQDCQYHFFSASHHVKRAAVYCLRSIAAQLAQTNKNFQNKLLDLHDSSGIKFNCHKQNFDTIWETIFEGIIFKLKFPTSLIWVLDAIDEVDSHQYLLSHLLRITSVTPIKIFFTSRPIKMPSAATTHTPGFSILFLSEEHTINDIRAFVKAAARDALPYDEDIRSQIVNQILKKSAGSFLWTKLAIEMLQDRWHTQDDIQEVLTEVPEGMEALYSRMLGKVMSQPARIQLMAKRILTWAACSWRPLHIDELRIALEPEFKGFVSLEDTIVQICGHFVSIDNYRISVIHITARHFLLDDRSRVPAFIQKSLAHEHIAVTCLKYLSDDTWRHTFKAAQQFVGVANAEQPDNRLLSIEQGRPFTTYSTYHWAYHASNSPLNSQPLREALLKFFSRYCLSWIEGVALSKDLHHLTRSAKYIKIYGKRLKSMHTLSFDPPVSLSLSPDDFVQDLQSWAMDLIRIVGKFGHNIVQRPSSIYRLIPPFCPRNSMIGKFSCNDNNLFMSVSGLPSERWDDCLATVSVGEDVVASKIFATDAHFFVLISSHGIVIIWHSETCEEARRIQHGEYVPHMALNRPGSLLTTAGIHTYRVWDVSTGHELSRIPKVTNSITMAIAFGSGNAELVVGLDDCSVRAYDYISRAELWRFQATDPSEDFHGCPRVMEFSPDMTKVAVAWRGRPLLVWDLAVPYQQPRQFKVTGRTDAMSAPDSVTWQYSSASILVLCQNGTLVEWGLYDEERVDHPHVTAREMAISPDGNLLLTSDNLGIISVWTFPRLNLIYQLTSTNEFIRDLAFSTDGQRFYDIRQSTCSVWEPDMLVRPDESDLEDRSSVGNMSIATEPVISHDEFGQVHVSALAPGYDGNYYCCGWEDGAVTIHEAVDGKRLRKFYCHASSSSITSMVWSSSGKYIVSADDSGRVVSKRLEVKAACKWSVFPVLDMRLDEPVQQFLFNGSERLLLISGSSTDIVFDLKTKTEVCRQRWSSRQRRRWVEHHENPKLLLWIDPTEVRTYDWATLSYRNPPILPASISASISNDIPTCLKPSNCKIQHPDEISIQTIALNRDKQHVVYELISHNGYAKSTNLVGLRLKAISVTDISIERPHSMARNDLTGFTGQVERLLGTYQDRMVFLDHDYWLCTWEFGADITTLQRHFFLPRDWLNEGTLRMAVLDAKGTLLCPKYGYVAIVRNGIKI